MRPFIRYNFLGVERKNTLIRLSGGPQISLQTLHVLHWIAAVLHAVQAAAVAYLIWIYLPKVADPPHGVFQLTTQLQKWENNTSGRVKSMVGNFTINTVQQDVFEVDVKTIIFIFFTLASLDHFITVLLDSVWASRNGQNIADLGARTRLLEYSISASLMAVAIAIETGIVDVFVLSGIFFLMWSCMLFGWFAETFILKDPVDNLHAQLAHLAGWIPFSLGYLPIIVTYYLEDNISNFHAPFFVQFIVWGQLFNFILFGIAQALYIFDFTSRNFSETVFLTLSITAKTMLAWAVLIPILQL